MNHLRRARLFVRDYFNEFGVAWSVARHRDCERSGGHRWSAPAIEEPFGLMETCERCGTGQWASEPAPANTTHTGSTTTVWVNATNASEDA